MKFRLKQGAEHAWRLPNREFVPLHPGQVIECEPEQLGGARDKFEVVEGDTTPTGGETTNPPAADFSVVAVEGGYNVIHVGSGAPINDEPLSREEAADLAGVPLESVPVAEPEQLGGAEAITPVEETVTDEA